MRTFRSEGLGGDLIPSHTGADLGASRDASGRGRWLSPARFIVAATIVAFVAVWLAPTLLRARQPSYEAQCLAKLKQVGWAFNMYVADVEAYPLASNWHWALRSYIDDPMNPSMRVVPGSRRDPLKCPMDRSPAPCSYLYLDRRVLDYTMARMNDAITPLAVDEYFHEKAILVYYDGHTDRLPKQQWVYERLRTWKVRRDLNAPDSFAYELLPGTQKRPAFAPPPIQQTEKYIWPIF